MIENFRACFISQDDFLNWIYEEEKNTEYWTLENGERIHPTYGADAIIDWLNNVRFKKRNCKSKINHQSPI